MGLLKDTDLEIRGQNHRGGVRVNSRCMVAVEWEEQGQALRAEGKTKDTSPQGCMVVVPHAVKIGQNLRLLNLNNQKSCEGVVIWRGEEIPTGWELGIQLKDASYDFWEMEF